MVELDFLKEHAKATAEEDTVDALAGLQHLVSLYDEQKDALERAEAAYESAKQALRQTATYDIPQHLLKHGLSEVRLSDGRKVIVKEEISPTVKDIDAFARFVTERGDEDILKTTFAMGRVPADIIAKLMDLFQDTVGSVPTVTQSVHPQTLKKYIKEISGIGVADPASRLGDRYVPLQQLPECVQVFHYYNTTIKAK